MLRVAKTAGPGYKEERRRKEDRTDNREIGDVKRIILLSFVFAYAVSSSANDSKVLIGGVDVPAPAGYVKISKGHPIDALLAKSESPDPQNEVLAHYVRSAVLQPDGTLCEGEDVLNGLLTLKVPRIKIKIDSADFELLSNAIAAGVHRGLRASKERDRAIGVLGARRFEDGSLSVGNARLESDDKRIERTKVTTSVISCCAGYMFTVVRTATAKDRDEIKSIHASSEQIIAEWVSSIRLAAGNKPSKSLHVGTAIPVVAAHAGGQLTPARRKTGWQSFLKGALIGAVTLLLVAVFRGIRSRGNSVDGLMSKKDVVEGRSREMNDNASKPTQDDAMADWRKVQTLRPLAEGGDMKAQFELGLIYFSGKGVVDDFRVARSIFALSAKQGNGLAAGLYAATKSPCGKKLLETAPLEPVEGLVDEWRRAAEGGSPDGCFCYGLTMLRKSSSRAEVSRALDYLKQAADAGFSTAQYIVGIGMMHGCGELSRDVKAGALLVGKAAMAGHDEALLCFSDFCRQGIVLPKDEEHALAYLQEAANSGNAKAQRLMSIAYANGDGVPKDAQKAKEYFDLAEGIHRPQVDWIGLMMKFSGLSEGEVPVQNADGSVRFSKIPPGGAMEMLRVAYEKTRAPQQPIQDGQLAFLNPGENGIMRFVFQKKQKKVVADHVKCRLYLPDGWNLAPELEAQSAANVIAKFAGPDEHEWMSVEHLFLSPDHVNDNLGDWVDFGMKLFGKAILHPAADKAQGVDGGKYLLFGKLGQRDALYMKYHQADDMVAYAGTFEIEEKLYRLFIVVLRRGRDSWKFEYVFPAAEGVTREALSFHSEEITSAARMFVPIETHGRLTCPLCGAGMDDPPDGKPIDGLTVEMKDFTLFEGGPKVGHAGMTLACCDDCKCKLPVSGIDRKVLEGVPDVRAQLDEGASIVEVKCGDRPVAIRGTCEKPRDEIANVIEEAKLWVNLRDEVEANKKRIGAVCLVDPTDMIEKKPVIYLYPETETRCSIRVLFDGVLTCTWPDYGKNGWQNFSAAPDGTLTFPDGRKYYCLFWEGRTNSKWDFSRGYCVKGSETASFLADVLAKMGLSFREANEFIIYWLPLMQNNPYNIIAFQGETYTKDAKLEIEPKPDSMLRIFMAWRASDQPINIPEPDIKPFERKGFTVVEWGGTEINK